MQTFIVGLLLAGVSAITVVAFKHPHGYARLFPYLLGTATMIFAGITLWHIAVEVTWRELDDYLIEDMRSEAEFAKEGVRLPYLWVAFWYSGLVAFLWLNLKLPAFLQLAEQGDTTIDGENTN